MVPSPMIEMMMKNFWYDDNVFKGMILFLSFQTWEKGSVCVFLFSLLSLFYFFFPSFLKENRTQCYRWKRRLLTNNTRRMRIEKIDNNNEGRLVILCVEWSSFFLSFSFLLLSPSFSLVFVKKRRREMMRNEERKGGMMRRRWVSEIRENGLFLLREWVRSRWNESHDSRHEERGEKERGSSDL